MVIAGLFILNPSPMNEGFIFLHRKLLEWEWYSDLKVTRLFIHLLLKANHKPNKWQGIEVQRGEHITSFAKLSHDTKLSVKEIRTAISKLKRTNEVITKSTSQNTIIQLVNYDKYQSKASEGQAEGQAKGKRRANEGQQTIMINKENNENTSYESSKSVNDLIENDAISFNLDFTKDKFKTEQANKAWVDWLEYRYQEGEPVNRKRQPYVKKELAKLATINGQLNETVLIEIVKKCIAMGWKNLQLTDEMEAKLKKWQAA